MCIRIVLSSKNLYTVALIKKDHLLLEWLNCRSVHCKVLIGVNVLQQMLWNI